MAINCRGFFSDQEAIARSRTGAWAEQAAASRTLIEGSDHLPMLERPPAFLDAVKGVLQLA